MKFKFDKQNSFVQHSRAMENGCLNENIIEFPNSHKNDLLLRNIKTKYSQSHRCLKYRFIVTILICLLSKFSTIESRMCIKQETLGASKYTDSLDHL